VGDAAGSSESHGAIVRRTEGVVVTVGEPGGDIGAIIDWTQLARWGRRHRVVLGGLAMIAAQLIWKGMFLSHFYFRQDDFHVFELALGSSFSWKYLTFIGAGHLLPGVYAIAWVVVRESLYNWGLATAVTLVLIAAASLAALRALRTLFGNRTAILIPLAIYLLTPLTLPNDGWWQSAVESVPLQIAIFMALNAHVHYVRTLRFRHAVYAAAWIAFGLFFFEKSLVLPLLLFAITAGFLLNNGSLLAATRRSAVRFWRAWLLYVALLVGYAILLAVSLKTSTAQPQSPTSVGNVFTFAAMLVKDTFVPGAMGGPWQWLPVPGGSYAFAAPPAGLSWLSLIVAVVIVGVSSWTRRRAWRGWAILAAWIVVADIAPVVIGRINVFSAEILGLETRYVADATAVLAICVGLVFLPLADQRSPAAARGARRQSARFEQRSRTAATALAGVVVFGSLWSVQAYQNVASGSVARSYIANARAVLRLAPRGTMVLDQKVPTDIVEGAFGQYAYASKVVGDMALGEPASKLRWIRQPIGTIDHLMAFGPDGRLYQTKVYGRTSVPINSPRRCWPAHNDQVVVPFTSPTSVNALTLRIDYLASTQTVGQAVNVTYGRQTQSMPLMPGLHTAYLPERGGALQIVVTGPAISGLCIGDAQAGILVPSDTGPVIPAIPR
jgi:hypothetical protein